MKKSLLTIAAFLAFLIGYAQTNNPVISSWKRNTTGQKAVYEYYTNIKTGGATTTVDMTDSAGVMKVCYNKDSVYIKTNSLAYYVMGPWLSDPNVPTAQGYTFRFPLSPSAQTGSMKATVPGGGTVGVGVDGVAFFGYRDADSYQSSTNTNTQPGDGNWHTDAWYNEGVSMDSSGNGHPDAKGTYHHHANPIALYSDPSSAHSPIVGFALDGFPIYGPFGYSTPTNASSNIKRMASSYQLRSITQRTILPDGSTSTPAGPNVSSSFPLGMYCEDYEYVNGLGDLDSLNGRYCVTPEYPSGTYAYFIATDSKGSPAFPYILGPKYYGIIQKNVMGPNSGHITIPAGVTCMTVTGITKKAVLNGVSIYPNPVSDQLNIDLNQAISVQYSISDLLGQVVQTGFIESGKTSVSTQALNKGIYVISLTGPNGSVQVFRIEKQ